MKTLKRRRRNPTRAKQIRELQKHFLDHHDDTNQVRKSKYFLENVSIRNSDKRLHDFSPKHNWQTAVIGNSHENHLASVPS